MKKIILFPIFVMSFTIIFFAQILYSAGCAVFEFLADVYRVASEFPSEVKQSYDEFLEM